MPGTSQIRPRPRRRSPGLSGILALIISAIAAPGLVCVSAGGAITAEETSMEIAPGAEVRVEARNARLRFVSSETGQFRARGELANPSRVNYFVQPTIAETPAPGVVVNAVIPDQYVPRARAIITLAVPDGVEITVDGINTSVSADGLSGVTADIRTDQGNVTLDNVSGELTVRTANGTVRMDGVEGIFDVRSQQGSINLAGVPDPTQRSRLETENGSILADVSGAPGARVEAHTERGVILIADGSQPLSGTDLQASMGEGDVTLELRTANGLINILP